jgi:hypothetical protein
MVVVPNDNCIVAMRTTTSSAALPLRPSAAAVIAALPGATAVTATRDPLPFTVATAGLLEVHVMLRLVSALPPASSTVAVASVVWPAARRDAVNATVIVATGAGPAASSPPHAVPIASAATSERTFGPQAA